ncbi:MAG TPA: serine/threonine-protein kinase, partial [Ktedonobacteraceae bacterium]|nr:serine/threonine-protein kinase [Ktedonobacteraceae bacterium]
MNAEALIGTVLGTCTLQQLVGQGGMGAVYLAQQSRPRRQVAVKVLMPATALKPHQLTAFLERFRRETDAAASLEHPNIMPVYEYGERGGLAYLVMPYISAGTLRDVMERDGLMTFNDSLNYLEQMAAALDFAHGRGVIHRDIKPAYMLLTPDGRLLLTDFGLVKILSDNQSEQMRLTGAGAPVGTPDYMSPEQVIGGEVDGRADQYSLGVVLFQMLTGTTPFQGETPMQIASQQLHMTPPMPRSLRMDLPETAERVLLRAMSKRPEERFPSTQEFATAFRAALTEPGYQNSLGISASRNSLLSGATATNISAVRKGNLFDPKWQGTGTMAAMDTTQAQFNTAASPLNAQTSMSSFNMEPESRPAGAGLLSKTGLFPRIGESTGAMQTVTKADAAPNSFFATGQMTATTNPQQASFGQPMGFAADTGAQPFGLQSSFSANSTGTLQQPFPTGTFPQAFPTNNLQQLSPAGQPTTSALSLLNAEPQAGNTIKLTGQVKIVKVAVAPGQYVTGLMPVQQEYAEPTPAPAGVKRTSNLQKIMLALVVLVLLAGAAGGGVWLVRSHNNSAANTPNSPGAANSSSTLSIQATATAQANILFSDPLTQNIHNFLVDQQHFFKNGAYHIVDQTSNGAGMVVQQQFNQPSLVYQITMEEIAGDETTTANTFGVMLDYNVNKKIETFYSFEILNEGTSSQYGFYKYDQSKSYPWSQIGKSMKTGKEFYGGH